MITFKDAQVAKILKDGGAAGDYELGRGNAVEKFKGRIGNLKVATLSNWETKYFRLIVKNDLLMQLSPVAIADNSSTEMQSAGF